MTVNWLYCGSVKHRLVVQLTSYRKKINTDLLGWFTPCKAVCQNLKSACPRKCYRAYSIEHFIRQHMKSETIFFRKWLFTGHLDSHLIKSLLFALTMPHFFMNCLLIQEYIAPSKQQKNHTCASPVTSCSCFALAFASLFFLFLAADLDISSPSFCFRFSAGSFSCWKEQ